MTPRKWSPPERVWIHKGDDRFPEDDVWSEVTQDGEPEYVRHDLYAALLARAEAAEAERNQWIANSRENKLIAESNLRERDAAEKRLAVARQRLLETETARCAVLAERDAARAELGAAEARAHQERTVASAYLGSLNAARAEAARLREAGRELHAAGVAAVGAMKPSTYKRGVLAMACQNWRAALATEARDE